MRTIPLCPHGMNQISCPTCFRLKPPAPKPVVPGTVFNLPDLPMGQVMPIGEAVLRATSRAATSLPLPPGGGGRDFKEPYRSSSGAPPPEAYDPNKLWTPPDHQDVIDRQPQHPHATEGRAQVLKA